MPSNRIMCCRHSPFAQGHQAARAVTPVGSVGSVTPGELSRSSSDLDPLTGASAVGQGRPRSSPESTSPRNRSESNALDNMGSPVSDQENLMPKRYAKILAGQPENNYAQQSCAR